jgi:hypothetical protein
VFVGDDDLYNCSNIEGINLGTWVVSQQECLFHDPQHFVLLFVGSSILITGLLTALITAKCLLKRRAPKAFREYIRMGDMGRVLNANDRHYEYDVFVSYDEEDGDWVRNVLAPEVEGRWGVRLCLHYRDFHPGKQILDIECCVNNSRRMMFIFYPYFAQSRWCRFELSLGLHQAMCHNENLLVVYLSNTAAEDMSAGMAAILRSNTCLRWAEQGWEAAQFWRSLRAALPQAGAVADVVDQPMRRAFNVDNGHYEYDVFVSYAEEDEDWVRNVLAPEVEGRWGVRLCLHYRDFHPGRQILDNTERRVEGSRMMMFVFSPHFARSRWCEFQLSMGFGMNRDDFLLVVYLSHVADDDLTPGMAAILKSCTFLEWARRGRKAAQFWNSLRAALPHGGEGPHAGQ